ncbi:hypothetical protein OpiT1DRAFT_01243 [Opitutaceae bacterium TAV1]|nr:hypothetical protein OpiT1DRAFT_01243 [Opitutaceae bacterium TAV1]
MKTGNAYTAKIRYRLSVLENGQEVRTLPFTKNLILDIGLEALRERDWDSVIRYARAGTSAEPTKRQSLDVTFTQAGATVTASAAFFVQEDAGRLLKLNTGEEMKILTFQTATQVTVSVERDSDAPTPGTIWYVNQTTLIAAVMSTETYGTGGADNSATIVGKELIRRRTFIFPARASLVTIREVGWGWYSGNNDQCFGRDVVQDGGVPLAIGQQLKIVLELVIGIAPLAPAALPGPFLPNGGGATAQLENLGYPGGIAPSRYDYNCVLGNTVQAFMLPNVSNGAGSLGGDKKNVNTVRQAYVAGTWRYIHRATFTLNDGNMEGITCAAIGWYDYNTFYPVFRVIFDTPQLKDSDHTLTIDWVIEWGRVLEN